MHGMQTRRPRSTALAAALAAFSVATALMAGCSSSPKQSSAPLPDPTVLLKESSKTTKNVKSVHLALSVNGKVKGLPLRMLSGDLTTVPDTAVAGNVQITMAGSDIDAPFVIYDNVLYAALTPNRWSSWGRASDIYDPSVILNPDTGLSDMLTNVTDAKAQGRDNVNGQSTIRITGKTPADAVNQIMPPLNATQPMTTTVWIQENGDHQLVQAQLEQSPGNYVQATLSKWGEPVQVTKPPVS